MAPTLLRVSSMVQETTTRPVAIRTNDAIPSLRGEKRA
jgi:hypothetical protein